MAQELYNTLNEPWKNITCNNINANNIDTNALLVDGSDIIIDLSDKVNKSGDTMTGTLNMNSNPITNMGYANFNGSYPGNVQKTISLKYGSDNSMIDNFLGNGVGNNDFILNCVDGFSSFRFLRANSTILNTESAKISDAGVQSTRGNFTAPVGGLLTQRMRFDTTTTNNQITSISGGISVIPLAGQALALTTSGAGTLTLQSALPLVVTSGINMQNSVITNTTSIDGGASAIQVGVSQPCRIPSKSYSQLTQANGIVYNFTANVWRLINLGANSIFNSTDFVNNPVTYSAQYNGTRVGRVMKVDATMCGLASTGNQLFTIIISKNGNIIPGVLNRSVVNFNNRVGQITISDFVTVNPTDTIQIAMVCDTTCTLTTSYSSLRISAELN